VPDRAQRELRALTRYRMSLVQERTAEVDRLQKTLEGANIKAAGIATDILGKSGRQMRDLLVAGETDPAVLAQCARGRMKEKIPLLERALAGRFGSHQRFLVARQLAHIDFLDHAIAEVSAEVAARDLGQRGPRGRADQTHSRGRALSCPGRAARQETGCRRRGSYHPPHRLPCAP